MANHRKPRAWLRKGGGGVSARLRALYNDLAPGLELQIYFVFSVTWGAALSLINLGRGGFCLFGFLFPYHFFHLPFSAKDKSYELPGSPEESGVLMGKPPSSVMSLRDGMAQITNE